MIPSLALNDGHSIPQLGLGTWPLSDAEVAVVVPTAIELGYRHIDTAAKYGNEAGVGEGIRRSGIDRNDLFITTKLDGAFQGGDRAIEGLRGCLERLDVEFVDLLLIHWPLPKRGEFLSTWRTFEKLQAEGFARSIGVSNFKPAHLDVLVDAAATVPAVNQVDLSPTNARLADRAYHDSRGIVTEAWSPIKDVLDQPVLNEIAAKHERSAAQIALRWHVQNGLVAIPKSANPERLAENIAIFDFELDSRDLEAIAALDVPGSGVDSDVIGH
ncbi:2,5-diketo-D-gluconate reductase A [Rhodoglobus vestalii]|uniref:2,5-diketo-D-gluconate reductase A n=1 Tax=Rhodoglobus vestalii TaxID=193384 RepID=A0A8H2PUP4_9MICO|nr:aldo/keto reductase [Rhodoglobus vestalii]TQO19912.1 2,5-diketo-D-gluconate reductase A [Rhodoglobus vestalii]